MTNYCDACKEVMGEVLKIKIKRGVRK